MKNKLNLLPCFTMENKEYCIKKAKPNKRAFTLKLLNRSYILFISLFILLSCTGTNRSRKKIFFSSKGSSTVSKLLGLSLLSAAVQSNKLERNDIKILESNSNNTNKPNDSIPNNINGLDIREDHNITITKNIFFKEQDINRDSQTKSSNKNIEDYLYNRSGLDIPHHEFNLNQGQSNSTVSKNKDLKYEILHNDIYKYILLGGVILMLILCFICLFYYIKYKESKAQNLLRMASIQKENNNGAIRDPHKSKITYSSIANVAPEEFTRYVSEEGSEDNQPEIEIEDRINKENQIYSDQEEDDHKQEYEDICNIEGSETASFKVNLENIQRIDDILKDDIVRHMSTSNNCENSESENKNDEKIIIPDNKPKEQITIKVDKYPNMRLFNNNLDINNIRRPNHQQTISNLSTGTRVTISEMNPNFPNMFHFKQCSSFVSTDTPITENQGYHFPTISDLSTITTDNEIPFRIPNHNVDISMLDENPITEVNEEESVELSKDKEESIIFDNDNNLELHLNNNTNTFTTNKIYHQEIALPNNTLTSKLGEDNKYKD